MNTDKTMQRQPDIKLAALEIWVAGRQFEEKDDYWDGNWLIVTVHCGSAGSDVWSQGPILHLSEVQWWLKEVRLLYQRIEGAVELNCMEPNLWVGIQLDQRGHGQLKLKVTPDNMREWHEYLVEIDQSYLPQLISSLEDILREYPIRSPRDSK